METTSKVSLRLTSRINLGRRGARAELSTLGTTHNPPPTHTHTHTHTHTEPGKGHPTAPERAIPQEPPIAPTGTIKRPQMKTAKNLHHH